MKTNLGCGPYHLANYVLFFSIILLLSCTSTSFTRLEGNDFEKNLPGLWEGNWSWRNFHGKTRIKIIKIEGNKVHLTGFSQGWNVHEDNTDVYGRLKDSTLLLTWRGRGQSGIYEKYTMNKDDSNNLILNSSWENLGIAGRSQRVRTESTKYEFSVQIKSIHYIQGL